MSTTTAHFSISGDFITEHVRNLLTEEKPAAAWNLLMESLPGITMEQAADVLSGRSKLVGVNNVDLVEDNPKADSAALMAKLMADAQEGQRLKRLLGGWRDVAGLAHMAYHPVLSRNGGGPKRGSPAGLIDEVVVRNMIGGDQMPGLLMQVFPAFTTEEYEAYFAKYGDALRQLVEESHPYLYREQSLRQSIAEKLPKGVVDAVMNPPAPNPAPKPGDISKEDNGWILPDGTFYPCGFMGHGQLACDLGVQDDKAGTALGWVRVGFSQWTCTRSVVQGNQEPTQSQINKVDAYCEVNDMELPTWAGGKGSGFKHVL